MPSEPQPPGLQPLNFDVVRDAGHLPPGVRITRLGPPEQRGQTLLRPVLGRALALDFTLSPAQAGWYFLKWRWWDVTQEQPFTLRVDGALPAGMQPGMLSSLNNADGALLRLAAGPHRVRIDFERLRPPTADDPRSISAALLQLQVQPLDRPPAPPGIQVGASLVALGLTWLLCRLLLRGLAGRVTAET